LKSTESKAQSAELDTEPRGGETQHQRSARMLALADQQLEDLRERHRAAVQRVADLNRDHHDAEGARRYAEAPSIRRECDNAERAAGALEQQIAMLETTRRSHAQAVDFWQSRERLRPVGAPGAGV